MLELGVQTKNIVFDKNPLDGFLCLKKSGFECCDFSLNSYLTNSDVYKGELNSFFDKSDKEFENYFYAYKHAALSTGIRVNQMHMPYPIYVPGGEKELNDYLRKKVAPASMKICAYFGCKNIVVHGFKLAYYVESEDEEWKKTAEFLEEIIPMAIELNITICLENLYSSIGNHIVEGSCCNAKKTAERIDYINKKYGKEVLGFCFDTGHANLVGIDFEDFIITMGNRIKVLHIHDNDGINDLHQIPFSFTRTRENKPSTDWDGFVRGLREIDYKNVISFETAPVLKSFPEGMEYDVLNFISQIGAYFKEEIEKN